MVYFNIGYNDMDFDVQPNHQRSFTFGNGIQDRLILNALEWLGRGGKQARPAITCGARKAQWQPNADKDPGWL
jgi:hypothetical protein